MTTPSRSTSPQVQVDQPRQTLAVHRRRVKLATAEWRLAVQPGMPARSPRLPVQAEEALGIVRTISGQCGADRVVLVLLDRWIERRS